MDPILIIFSSVVVVFIFIVLFIVAHGDFIWIYRGNVIFRTFPQNIAFIHQTDQEVSTDNIWTSDANTTTDPYDISVNKSTQTDDSDLFITCYDHIQVQRRENLLATDTLEYTFEKFSTALNNILEHSDWNFQVLAYQLWMEFHGYMQYALMQAAANMIPILEPIDFQTLPDGQWPEVLNLHFKHHQQFDTFELQEADEEIDRETQGTCPKDPMRPWSSRPFGRCTRSQASFAKRWACQEDYLKSKR